VIAGAPSFRHPDPLAVSRGRVEAAARKPYARLRADHVAEYQRFFHRVEMQLDGPPGRFAASELPGRRTARWNARLLAPKLPGGPRGTDPRLMALYFQFGRYLLISSSRPGSLAANMQGRWSD